MNDSAQITTGRELNSYEGNAALASGDNAQTQAVGYAKADLTPLENYAINKYKTNLLDYEQQQQDKKELQAKFTDPSQNVFLDETYADQVKPLIDRQKELSMKNLQMNPNSKEWYEFHDNYNKLLNANAQLKTVQTLKQKYQDGAGASADPHEKERMLAYADKLGKYKVGEEIPSYDRYFAYNDAHVPSAQEAQLTYQRVDPKTKNILTVKKTINNPIDLLDKVNKQDIADPTSEQTSKDIAHTLLMHGGIPKLNETSLKTYGEARAYNLGLMKDKYKDEFDKYQKEHPGRGFQKFIDDTGKTDEVKKNIDDKLDYLKSPVRYVNVDPTQPKMQGFTYSDDGKTMLSVPDKYLLAIMGASKQPVGAKEEIIKDEVSKLPSEINENDAQAAAATSNAKTNRIKAMNDKQEWQAKLGFEKWKEKQKGKSDAESGFWLNDQTTSLISDAKKNVPIQQGTFAGEFKSGSKDLKSLFTIDGLDKFGKKNKNVPSEILITKDNKIRPVYLNDKGGVDERLSQPVSADEAKAKIAKYQFGDKAQKVLEQSNEILTSTVGQASLNENVDKYFEARNPKKIEKYNAATANPNKFKQEGKYWRYEDGTLVDATGKIVKEKK